MDRIEMEKNDLIANAGKNIRALRALYPARLTQEGLAKAIGIGREWVASIETGNTSNVTIKTLCRLWYFLAPKLPFHEIFANRDKSMEDRIGYYARLLKATLNKNHVLRILRFLDADTLYTPETLAAFALEYRFIIEDEAPKAQKVLTQWAKKQAFPKRGDGLLEGTQTPAWLGSRWKASVED